MDKEKFEKILKSGISGIKRIKRQKRFSRFSHKDGVYSKTEAGRFYVPGQGIVEASRQTQIIFDCGHPASYGLGHQADCGHVICRMCTDTEGLVCAERNCFRKFCTLAGCKNHPHVMGGLLFCRHHQTGFALEMLSLSVFSGMRKARNVIEDMQQEYSLRYFRKNRKELPDAGKNFPGRSSRAL